MTYTVLARRYRSRDFDELVGQEPIARTLQNAIDSNRTAHAYLFCGTRGVGKTSLARIFARALNVQPDLAEADAIAEAIFRGDDLDVIEIDGASNRGVQEARDLIAGAGLRPTRSPYKIYIIDEVHMLTREAFNTLLKTMEEPPEHVKFILCTTEPQKVPATIQSRCQRFDFRAIPSAKISAQLGRILGQEGIEAEPALVDEVARLGHGSMRDALSLLDRLIAAADGPLTLAGAEAILGRPDRGLVNAVAEAVVARDPGAALTAGAQLIDAGATVELALELLAEHWRTVMLVRACGEQDPVVDAAPDVVAVAARHAESFDLPALVYLIAVCDSSARRARGSSIARALLDAALVRMALAEQMADVSAVLSGTTPAPAPAAAPKRSTPKKKERPSAVDAPDVTEAARADAIIEPRPVATPSPAAAPREPAAPDVMTADALWNEVTRAVRGTPGDEARIRNLMPVALDGRTLTLRVDASGAASARFLASQRERLAELIERSTGRRIRVEIERGETTESEASAAPSPARPTVDLDAVRDHELVKSAVEVFDAVVTDVQPRPPAVEGGA